MTSLPISKLLLTSRYTLDLIVKKTGQTLSEFRANKSAVCDELPDTKSEVYTESLRQAAYEFKQKQCGSLFQYASKNQVIDGTIATTIYVMKNTFLV